MSDESSSSSQPSFNGQTENIFTQEYSVEPEQEQIIEQPDNLFDESFYSRENFEQLISWLEK